MSDEPEIEGIFMGCPKCGCRTFGISAGAVASVTQQIIRTPQGELVVLRDEWEVVEVIEDRPYFCIECGHEPKDRDLAATSG